MGDWKSCSSCNGGGNCVIEDAQGRLGLGACPRCNGKGRVYVSDSDSSSGGSGSWVGIVFVVVFFVVLLSVCGKACR